MIPKFSLKPNSSMNLEVGDVVVLKLKHYPELERFFYPGVSDAEFTIISETMIDDAHYCIIGDGQRVFTIQIETPTNNKEALSWLDKEY